MKLLICFFEARHDRCWRHSGEDATLPPRHRCRASSSWTTAMINDDNPARLKNVPWNWPRPSIGTTAKAKGRRRSAGAASVSATTTVLCGRMTGPSSTVRRRRGRFSPPNGRDVEEDRGSNGNNGTPDDRGSREERDYGTALPATAVNPLDSVKRMYRRRLEGGVAERRDGNG